VNLSSFTGHILVLSCDWTIAAVVKDYGSDSRFFFDFDATGRGMFQKYIVKLGTDLSSVIAWFSESVI
jgi:hypothetical protein